MSIDPNLLPEARMTHRTGHTVDLHNFAPQEFLEFVRQQGPSWLEGAHIRRSHDGHQRLGVVEGKVWLEVLMSDKTAEAMAHVLARTEAFDKTKAAAVLSLRKALRLGDVAGA